MFTGLVADVGRVAAVHQDDDGAVFDVATPLAAELRSGDSVAVNGVCLTASEVNGGGFQAEAMNETLVHSSLGGLDAGAQVNLELPLRAGDRIGGHLVQGHVDAVGEVLRPAPDLWVRTPQELLPYLVKKGSVAVDGCSLTVVDVDGDGFGAAVIPHTAAVTTLGTRRTGDAVNLEADVIAKYVERLLVARTGG
jgi:riboflavin synthase